MAQKRLFSLFKSPEEKLLINANKKGRAVLFQDGTFLISDDEITEDMVITYGGIDKVYDYSDLTEPWQMVPWALEKDKIRTVIITKDLNLHKAEWFKDAKNLTKAVLPGLRDIPQSAFERCVSLRSVEFSDKLANIDEKAFSYCTGLRGNLIFPNTLHGIDRSAFECCIGLDGVIDLANTEHIGAKAFDGCTSVAELRSNNKLKTIGSQAFEGNCRMKGSFEMLQNVEELWHCAFQGCSQMTGDATFPEQAVIIGDKCLLGTGVTSVQLPVTTKPLYYDKGWKNNTTYVGYDICDKTILVTCSNEKVNPHAYTTARDTFTPEETERCMQVLSDKLKLVIQNDCGHGLADVEYFSARIDDLGKRAQQKIRQQDAQIGRIFEEAMRPETPIVDSDKAANERVAQLFTDALRQEFNSHERTNEEVQLSPDGKEL